MRFTALLASIIIMALCSCSSSHEDSGQPLPYNALTPTAGMARFVVYYPYSYIWKGRTADIKVDGEQDCRITSGDYFLRDVSPGMVEISASLCNGNGVTRLTVNALPNRRYYIQVTPKDKSLLGLIAGYNIPSTANATTHAEGTAFYIDLMDEQTANTQLGKLKMVK